MPSPSELLVESESIELSIVPAIGGRIHRLRAFGQDLLRTPADVQMHRADPFFWGAYPMAPWCNRAEPGRRTIAGREVRLRSNFDGGWAIHGLVSSMPWDVNGPGSLSVTHEADDGWPWRFEVHLDATVDGGSVRLAYRLTNRSDAPMPAGIGLHPWVRAPVRVRLPADAVYPSNTDSAAVPEAVAGRFDLRRGGIPAGGLDGTWTGLTQSGIELAWPGLGVEAVVTAETNADGIRVALATPPQIPAVALEPQTHGPDPLRRLERGEPDAPTLLAPGADLTLIVGVNVAQAPGT